MNRSIHFFAPARKSLSGSISCLKLAKISPAYGIDRLQHALDPRPAVYPQQTLPAGSGCAAGLSSGGHSGRAGSGRGSCALRGRFGTRGRRRSANCGWSINRAATSRWCSARTSTVPGRSRSLEARERVHEMVRNEQRCCGFLAFELRETGNEIHLTITAPERARGAADALFEQFVADAPAPSSCACAMSASVVKTPSKEPPGSKAAGVTAVTLSTGAVACGVCCVLPFALPATILASTGSLRLEERRVGKECR